MRRLLAAVSVAAIVLAWAATPASAAQRRSTTITVSPITLSPSEGGQQVITITGDSFASKVSFNAGPMYSRADRPGDLGRCSLDDFGKVHCDGSGPITIFRVPTPLDPSLHGANIPIIATIDDGPDTGQSNSGLLRIRFKADVLVSGASYDLGGSGNWLFRTTWGSNGPDQPVGVAIQVSGVNASSKPSYCTGSGPYTCHPSGSGGTITFQIPRCSVLGGAQVQISASSTDSNGSNNSKSASPPPMPAYCGTASGGGEGSPGGGGPSGGASGTATPDASSTVEVSGTGSQITVVAGGGASRSAAAAPLKSNGRVLAAISVAVATLLLAIALIVGWLVWQRRQRDEGYPDPW